MSIYQFTFFLTFASTFLLVHFKLTACFYPPVILWQKINMGRFHLLFLVLSLSLVGVGVAAYKAFILGFPVAPDQQMDVWIVESHFSFTGTGAPAKLSVFIPDNSKSYLLEDESFVNQGFGFSTLKDGLNRSTVWAKQRTSGLVDLYYRTVIRAVPSIFDSAKSNAEKTKKILPKPEPVKLDGMALQAAQALLKDISQASADTETLVSELFHRLNDSSNTSHQQHLLGVSNARTSTGITTIASIDPTRRGLVAQDILNLSGVPSRLVRGISLKESASNVSLITLLEVFYDRRWHLFDPTTGEEQGAAFFLPWYRGEGDAANLTGGTSLRYKISVQRLQEEAVAGALKVSKRTQPFLSALSLYRLPVEVQSVYKVLLMIPLGALLVVVLRNVVGIKTLGTFMPVLIALSFRESDPVWGGVLFSFIVAVALIVRAYFEHLRLLLVPRLAAVLTVIILIMLCTSILLFRLGVERGTSVALFPMVILTMVVERMSLAWEELGPQVAIRQGMMTLLVALTINYVISIRWLSHILFVFPELLLVLLSINLLLGRYTGYRLTELKRFKSLAARQGEH
jgi:hypothetical protein